MRNVDVKASNIILHCMALPSQNSCFDRLQKAVMLAVWGLVRYDFDIFKIYVIWKF